MSVTAMPIDRRVTLNGSYNFRDLGGLRTTDGREVQRGRLFRSDELHRLTPEDIEILAGIGIATLIDLRSMEEVTTKRATLLHDRGVAHRHLPMSSDPSPERYAEFASIQMDELYFRFIDERRESLIGVFAALAEAEIYPAVVHCAAGKDRTGMTVALVLRALGVADEEIIADYALTDEAMTKVVAALRASGREEMLKLVPAHFLRADPETMERFLERFDAQYGSMEAFLTESGITSVEVAALRENLLAPTAS